MSELIDILQKTFMPEIRSVDYDDCHNCATDAYIDKILDEVEENKIEGIETAEGATQFCFIDKLNKIVYKIPFNYNLVYDKDLFDEDNKDIIEEDYSCYNLPMQRNYTAYAETIYKLAKDFHVEQFFAKVEIVGYSINKLPFWKQPLCIPFNLSKAKKPSKDSLNKIKEMQKDGYFDIPFGYDDWCAECIDAYGEEAWMKLLNFIDKYDIHDLHSGNYGWDAITGKPIIFDYSGYNEDY